MLFKVTIKRGDETLIRHGIKLDIDREDILDVTLENGEVHEFPKTWVSKIELTN